MLLSAQTLQDVVIRTFENPGKTTTAIHAVHDFLEQNRLSHTRFLPRSVSGLRSFQNPEYIRRLIEQADMSAEPNPSSDSIEALFDNIRQIVDLQVNDEEA